MLYCGHVDGRVQDLQKWLHGLQENAWATITNAARKIVADAEDKMQNSLHRAT
jgi:hypothetical protein